MIPPAALHCARAALRAAGFENPGLEARWLAEHATGEADLAALLARRLAHEPMAHIIGHQGFWTLDLEVSPATLIPRADSETLIEAALAAFPDRARLRRILDLGTGTGCLLLAALSEFPAAWGLGIDAVPEAAALAARNAVRNNLAGRAAFLVADWAAPLAGRFDLILANPPYIARADLSRLMPEVGAHEPASALDGGADGLDAYRRILPGLPALLAPGGAAILELGAGQAQDVATLAITAGFAPPTLRTDIGGIARAMVLRR
ncbi:MAG: peptide chain release factor N(5)-glutamine methyltransferase [Rhodospirillales bacterium]|nr:peptide chain release factor N(5)-glutamine methyltransferase [Rhodospirillales bacterium]